jgi:hypothetical protein
LATLTIGQLVALRFASDDELPGLVRQVLSGTLTDRRAIKKAIFTGSLITFARDGCP